MWIFQTKKVTIKELFLGFVQIHSKDAASLERVIVEKLEADNIPLADCRLQCYDNAAVITGHISGIKQRICARNHRTVESIFVFLSFNNSLGRIKKSCANDSEEGF